MKQTLVILKEYFDPLARLGNRTYSIYLPFAITLGACFALEFYAFRIANNPAIVARLAIIIFIAIIIYFSFRDGIMGGLISSAVTIFYYGYIIYTRGYTGSQLVSAIQTTIFLGILYVGVSLIIGWLKQTIDILLEREKDEKSRLQAVIQQLPVGVIITDHEGKIVQVNKQVDTIFDMRVPIGDSIHDKLFFEPEKNGKKIKPSQFPLVQAIEQKKPIVTQEFTIQDKKGNQKYIQVNATPVLTNKRRIIAASSIISDVTEQKEAERRKDDFVNMASHELKTPLTSMKLYLDLMVKQVKKHKDKDTAKILKNIQLQTERLQKLVNDLLDVSRLQTGKLSLNKEHFELNDLLKDIVDVLKVTTVHRIHFVSKSKLPVLADKFRIYQVFTNILTNAIKYSPAGKPIKVTTLKKNGKATVRVKDQGMGIAQSEQKKIFERLYQVTDAKVQTFPGFGMGLYIAREIIKRHKGKIWVESTKGKGSAFYFDLPLVNERQRQTA